MPYRKLRAMQKLEQDALFCVAALAFLMIVGIIVITALNIGHLLK
jgi:hypothetical protein